MKIMFVAPRFHTNQIPIVAGLLKEGNNVIFCSQYAGNSEEYRDISPVFLGYSRIFGKLLYLHNLFNKKKLQRSEDPSHFSRLFGFPPIFRFISLLRNSEPDIVITRDRSVYSIVTYVICMFLNTPCILYNQTPLFEMKQRKNIVAKIVRILTPRVRVTPVIGNIVNIKDKHEHDYYLPFVINTNDIVNDKVFFRNDNINILSVGKFQSRKNHHLLISVISKLSLKYKITLTLVGEVSTDHHKMYINKLRDQIVLHNLEEVVFIKTNISYTAVLEEYKNCDLFILPSTKEAASISQLEAMSFGVPIIISESNGFNECVKHGENGYLFKDNDEIDLHFYIEEISKNRDKIKKMGKKSIEICETEYSFNGYYSRLMNIIKTEHLYR